MKHMRKLLAALLAFTMFLALAACGGGSGGGEPAPSASPTVAERFKLDLESTEEQPMSEGTAGPRDALHRHEKSFR